MRYYPSFVLLRNFFFQKEESDFFYRGKCKYFFEEGRLIELKEKDEMR